MSALEAARLGDGIGHTSALAGLIVGALAAAAVAVAVVAIVGTGGMAAVAVGAGIAAAAAGGGLGGAYIGELIPTSPTGAILTGSFDVFVGSPVLGAARASIDVAACSGVFFPHATPVIAQGSSNVFINNMMAARRTDKLVCGAAIAKGCPDVFIGGGTANVPGLTIDEDVPEWLKTTLVVVALVGGVIATGGAILAFGAGPAIGGLVGGYLGGKLLGAVGGALGNKIGGYFGNAQLGERIGEVTGGFIGGLLGGMAGAHVAGSGAPTGEFPPEGEIVPPAELPEPVPEPAPGGSSELQSPTEPGTPSKPTVEEPSRNTVEEPSQNNENPDESRPVDDRPCEGDPVDVVTGEVCILATDFVLPGALPLQLQRTYASGLKESSCFGPKWRSNWGQFIEEDRKGNPSYITADGQKLRVNLHKADTAGWLRTSAAPKVKLRRTASGYAVLDHNRNFLHFEKRFANRWLLCSITDPNRNQIQFHYSEDGALRRVLHSGGYRLQVSGTSAQIWDVSLELEDGTCQRLVSYQYDHEGRLTGIINGSGLPLTYEYDDSARLIRWADRAGTWYGYRYDAEGRCVEIAGNSYVYWRRFIYEPALGKTTVSGSDRGIRTYIYNSRKQVTELIDALGGVTRTKWNSYGQKTAEIDPSGRSVYFHYDKDGNLISSIDPFGRSTDFRCNAAGQPELIVDAAGRRWIRKYDSCGNLVEAGLEGAGHWRYERDVSGNLTRIIDPAGKSRSFTYNALGLLVSSTDWKGNRITYVRDALGRIIRQTDPLGRQTNFSYYDLDKLAEVERPDGSKTQWEFNAEGMITKRIEPDGRTYTYTYGPFDKTASVHQPDGGRLRFAYDLETRLQAVENERGEVYRYVYDKNGNLVEEIDWSGRRLRYEYDAAGFCTKRTNGKGEETVIERDAVGQVTAKRSSDGSVALFQYNEYGQVLEARNQSITVRLERDVYGRVTQELQGEHSVKSVYDRRGLRIRRVTSTGNSCDWTYDDNGLPEALRLSDDQLLEFDHDAVGREVQRRFGTGFILRQSYDALDQLTEQWAGLDGNPIVERSYCYDLSLNPVEIDDRRWGKASFEYDGNGRIQNASYSNGESEQFRYDPAGNIVKSVFRLASDNKNSQTVATLKSHFLSRGGRLEQTEDRRYFYDEDGRVIEKHDNGKIWKYDWTAEGQLRSVLTPSGERWSYEYDAFGRRIRKQGPDTSITYLWDGPVIAEEIRREAAGSKETAIGWVFEPGSFRPLAKQEKGQTYLCVTDQVGTPRELIKSSGELAWSARFSVWGQIQEQAANITDCPFRFQGQWLDEESGLYYNRYRYYESESGRYLSPDPIGLSGGSRLYGYVHNPLAWIDPFGLAACDNRNFSNRKEAFNAAKDRAGIPRSQSPNEQWTVGNDPTRIGSNNYRYSEDPGTWGRYSQYDTPQGSRVIAEHTADPNAPNPHFHAGQPKGDPATPAYDFKNNRYSPVDGRHHYYYTP